MRSCALVTCKVIVGKLSCRLTSMYYFHQLMPNIFVLVTESNILGRVDRNLEVKLDFVCRTIAELPDIFVAMTTEEEEEDCFGEYIMFSCLFPLRV